MDLIASISDICMSCTKRQRNAVQNVTKYNQRTDGPVNAHLISGPTLSTKPSFAEFDIVLKWVKLNSGSLYI